ncbi:MAG TPA: hypothetical protein VF174_15700 [Micromonosporaceae bacterium]
MSHVYVPDASVAPDHRDRRPCTCGMPKSNRVHELPEVPDEAKLVDARKLGEA